MITRVRPIKDTFTIGGLLQKNNGLDEILEIGHSDLQGAEGSSRAFLAFRFKLPENFLNQKHRVVLNVLEVRSENLPEKFSVDICRYNKDWVEGTGHISDEPFEQNGLVRGTEVEDFEVLRTVEFTKEDDSLDLRVDLTDLIETEDVDLNLMIKLTNEDLADSQKTRVFYYSSDTHTCSWPYIDLEQDDSLNVGDLPEIESTSIRLVAKGLGVNVTKGDKVRVDVVASPEYPTRAFSTSSIYKERCRVPEGLKYGIVDEYTGEVVVEPLNNVGTFVSSDDSGSFFILDTSMLESERYYRIVFSGSNCKHSFRILTTRNTFKVTAPWRR